MNSPATRDSAAARLPSAAMTLSGWRERLARSLFLASGIMHLIAVVLVIALVRPHDIGLPVTILLAGLTHLAVFGAKASVTLRAWIYLVALVAEVGLLGARFAWAPAIVLTLLSGTVVGGVLLGWVGAILPPAAATALLGVGGLLVRGGYRYSPSLFDLDDASSWFRVTFFHLALVGVMGFGIRLALRGLIDARRQALLAVADQQRELNAIERTKASRQAAELALLDAQKLQTVAQLSSGVAHLLNNALTVVQSAADHLGTATSSREIHDAVRGVLRATEPATLAISELLVFSRKEHPAMGTIALEQYLAGLDAALEHVLPPNVSIERQIEPLPPVLAEPLRLTQLIFNLVLNASDALPAGGIIRFSARLVLVQPDIASPGQTELAPGRYIEFVVADDGEGMPADVVSRACEPFFTTRGSSSHAGLGLFIVYGLVKRWGGALRIESKVGEGTRVVIWLPAAPTGIEPIGSIPAYKLQMHPGQSIGEERSVSSPSNAPDASDSWKESSLRRAAFVATVTYAVALLGELFVASVADPVAQVVCGTFFFVSLACWRWQGMSLSIRLVAIAASMEVTSAVTILKNGYMTPVVVATIATTVLLVAVYAGARATWVALGASATPFLLGALGPVAGSWHNGNVLLDRPPNWWRIALVLPCVTLMAASLVIDVIATVKRLIEEREHVLHRLDVVRREHMAETTSLHEVQDIAARTARLDFAGLAVGGIAHDLNNALGAILGWASVLEDEPAPSAEDLRETVQVFRESAEYAGALVQQLGTGVTVVAAGKQSSDVGEVLQRVGRVIEILMRKRVDLHFDVGQGCHVPLERSELQRVLLNLAANARDAMPQGGVFTVQCRSNLERREVVVEVEDTGTGMSEATRSRAFDAFFTTKTRGKGTGLGLYTIAHIVKTSGGRIDLTSAVGQGTKIELTWPLVERPREADSATVERLQYSGGRLLVVEDNEWVRRAMLRALSGAGFEVDVAVDGNDAVTRIRQGAPYRMLITDASMPGCSVAEVVREYAAHHEGSPVLVCSGLRENEVGPILESTGAAFLGKPFAPDALVSAVRSKLCETQSVSNIPGMPRRNDGRTTS